MRGGVKQFDFGHVKFKTHIRHSWKTQTFKTEVQGDHQRNKCTWRRKMVRTMNPVSLG